MFPQYELIYLNPVYRENVIIYADNPLVIDNNSSSICIISDCPTPQAQTQEEVECKGCGTKVPVSDSQSHTKRCQLINRGKFKCFIKNCPWSFKTTEERNGHEEVQHGPTVTCPYKKCNKKWRAGSLYKHIEQVHFEVKVDCESCGKLVSKVYLPRHIRHCLTRDTDARFKCCYENCTAKFKTLNERTRHSWRVHGPAIKCPYENCDKMVKKVWLPKHIKQTHEEKRNTCDNCGKDISSSYIKRHLEVCLGTGDKVYQCEVEGCGKSFKTMGKRTNHKWMVHKEKVDCPYDNCFSRIKPAHLSRHIKTCHGEKAVSD